MRVPRTDRPLARRAQRGSSTALAGVTALIYLIHAVAVVCVALLRPPGTNSPRALGALALATLALAAYAFARGRRMRQGEATVMLALPLGAAAAMSHATPLDLAALTNGLGLSMLGAYASWLLAWPGAVTFYAGLSAWVAVVAARGESYLTVAAALLAAQAVVMCELVRALRRRVLRLTQFDPLTGALNRRGVADAVSAIASRMGRRAVPVSVALIDLDDLRQVNNTAGHLAGDALLVAATDEWRHGFPDASVTVARIGGDEFLLLFEGTDDVAARTMLDSLHATSAVRWSAGVTQLRPGEALDSALARADAEMYATKDAKRARLAGA